MPASSWSDPSEISAIAGSEMTVARQSVCHDGPWPTTRRAQPRNRSVTRSEAVAKTQPYQLGSEPCRWLRSA